MIEKSSTQIKEMFNLIAYKYDFCNNIISFFTHLFVKKYAIAKLQIRENSKILDVCCGTGDLLKIIQKACPKCEVSGIDFSANMIEIAKKKGLNCTEGDVTNLAIENETYDYVTESFGLRNIPDREKALKEVYRILKSGGKFMHLDFGKQKILSILYNQYVLNIMKIFTKHYSAYKYFINSIEHFPNSRNLQKEIEQIGFHKILIQDIFFGIISLQIYEK